MKTDERQWIQDWVTTEAPRLLDEVKGKSPAQIEDICMRRTSLDTLDSHTFAELHQGLPLGRDVDKARLVLAFALRDELYRLIGLDRAQKSLKLTMRQARSSVVTAVAAVVAALAAVAMAFHTFCGGGNLEK